MPARAAIAAAARGASSQLAQQEEARSSLKEALLILNHMSAHALRKDAAVGGDAQGGDDPTRGLLTRQVTPDEEPSRSFMIKKGDADVHEKFHATMARTNTGSTSSG